jgi:SAM-dependent methyltransferase
MLHHVVEALIRESQYRPIVGEVVLVGRQTVYFSPQAILNLLREHGVDTQGRKASDLETGGHSTIDLPTFSNQRLITDSELFRLLGVPKILALDHSDYEGAEILHDLTRPIPDNLRRCADFILDGSTLDNVFDPASVISNFAEMLRPGGRLISTNMYSNHYEPYVILPPLWYFDYFTINGFADCKVYILVYDDDNVSDADVFTIDLDALLDPKRSVSAFSSPQMMATIVVAEKGADSTSHLRPSQQHYRSASDWAAHRKNLARIRQSQRPHLARTRRPISFDDVKAGHLFMASDFTARDPMSEILARESQKGVSI